MRSTVWASNADQSDGYIQGIFNAKHEAWNISTIEEEWILAVECRLMNMQRHLQQAMSKKQAVAWLQQMPYYSLVLQYKGLAAVAGSGETQKDEATKKAKEKAKEYVVRYDAELRKGVRSVVGSKKVRWEAGELRVPDDASGADAMTAEWEDGMIRQLPQLTVAAYRSQEAVATPEVAALWQGEHHRSHHKLAVRTKANRGQLMVLFEQGKQVLGVRTALFTTKVGEDGEGECATRKAAECVIKVSERYAKGQLAKDKVAVCSGCSFFL